jgi:hypothetical protein
MAAILTANKLPKPVLLALRDRICEHTKGRKGREWDLMRAYATFLEGPLETARMRRLQELYGLREVPPLAPFIEDEADESDDGGADEAVERCPDNLCLGAIGRTPGRATLAYSGSVACSSVSDFRPRARRASRRASIRPVFAALDKPRSARARRFRVQ